ncbi:uncharacterized protein LOC141598605 isoform X2 [Silene latifolia]|uniref:uncharacterized protein LOC141598605 isoform X2 n=1 Tax=Silene latifolia TaxID=37657 RepID=UPI003D788486
MESYQPPHAPPSDPQFSHYHHHNYHQYPPPPPPPPPHQQQQNQWGPPPPPPQQQPHPAYPAHPPPPYHAPHIYPPPPPPPPPSYPNQDWGNGNWTHHAGWEYPAVHSNEEDWAAKAKAWASARSSVENQQPQSATRQEHPSPYDNQYPPPNESHYQDVQTHVSASDFSSYQGYVAPSYRPPGPPAFHQQEPASVSSYASESHFSLAAKDTVLGGDKSAEFAHHRGPTYSSVHQQEVPSSYSPAPGTQDGLHGMQHGNSLLPADGRLMPVDYPQFAHGNHSLDPRNQPLEFASTINHEVEHKMMSGYSDSYGPVRRTDYGAAVSSLQSWTAPDATYPPIAPAFPSALQHDIIGGPPQLGQPSVSTHVGLSSGMPLHSAASFPVDAYGIPLSSERPKKAAVPNWLREEIIKSKATIAKSASEHFKEGNQSIEDELIDKPIGIGDQEDSKSIDSAMSAEEDNNEDEEEDVQRTAAINQEIKRVLTEVLLKVTDELFDEIATKVLSEDDHTSNGVDDSDKQIPVPKVSLPPVSAPMESAKVTIPAKVKVKEPEEHASGETSSGSPVNILGLSNYASDEDDEIQASSLPQSKSNEAHGTSENGHLQIAEEHKTNQVSTEVDNSNRRPIGVHAEYGMPVIDLSGHRVTKDLADSNDNIRAYSLDEKGVGVTCDDAKSTDKGRKETVNGLDVHVENLNPRSLARDSSQERSVRRREKHDSIMSSSGRDSYKETKSTREREAEKDEIYSRQDERHRKKDNMEDSKRERVRDKKVRSPRHGEKAKESGSSKRSPHREGKDSKYESERNKRRSSKDDGDRKRGRTKEEKGDKSRHKSTDAGRHKRRRSSSVDDQGKQVKEPVLSDSSSDEVSEDSRRKNHSKRRNLSPSPVRSRRRQVSRSPRSKHTQRRHSPYSSLDDSRERRSRSPVRRHRK